MAATGTPDVQPDETTVGGSEPPAEDLASPQQVTLDSGIGTDTLPSGLEEPGRPDATSSDSSFQETPTFQTREDTVLPPPAPERRSSAGALIGAGLLGGVVGAGLLYGLQAWQTSPGGPAGDLRLAQLEQRVGALRQPGPPGPAAGNLQALRSGSRPWRPPGASSTSGSRPSRDRRAGGPQAQEALNRPVA